MNKERIAKVLDQAQDMDALLLSDPYAIYYLIGKKIEHQILLIIIF